MVQKAALVRLPDLVFLAELSDNLVDPMGLVESDLKRDLLVLVQPEIVL
jgi:hypothetical protein